MQAFKSFTANLPAVDMTSVRKNLGNTYQATRYVRSPLFAAASRRDVCYIHAIRRRSSYSR